jgi:transposase-like protein
MPDELTDLPEHVLNGVEGCCPIHFGFEPLPEALDWIIFRGIRRCFKPVDLLPSRSQSEPSTRVREAMIIQVLHCPYCQGSDIVKHGMSPEGKQRYRCRACLEGRGRTFLLEYSYAGQSPEVKQQIVDMAMNASGIRDTARVLHVSPTTVINE